MMLPKMNEVKRTGVYVKKLGGLCRLAAVPDGCMTDMNGITSGEYPAAAARAPYKTGKQFEYGCNGIFAGEKLMCADGTLLYYGGTRVNVVLSDTPKLFAGMGSGIYVFPDKVRFDTVTGEVKYLENTSSASGAEVCLCGADGEPLTDYTVSAEPPPEPLNGEMWLDIGSSEYQMNEYSAQSACWVPASGTAVSVSATGIGHGFRAGDAVEISGLTDAALNGQKVLLSCGEDSVSFTGTVAVPYTDTGTVTVKRTVPDMAFVCERDNRLWGASADGHEIYACALGDAFNWQLYQGLSTDSYAVTVGSPGPFTGCVSAWDSVWFFKENGIVRVSGSRPANFRLDAYSGNGIASGSASSAAVTGDGIYYLSRSGMMRTDAGGMPYPAGLMLGREAYSDASGCAAPEGGYLTALTRENGSREVLYYDPSHGMWTREADGAYTGLTRLGECVYAEKDGCLVCLRGSPDGTICTWEDEPVRVSGFTTGDLGMLSPKKKRFGRLNIRAELEKGAEMNVFVMYDGDGVWRHAGRSRGTGTRRAVDIPIIPARCDHMRLKTEWTGRAAVFSISMAEEREG